MCAMDSPTQDRLRGLLAAAWRDLAGDHEGMVWLEQVHHRESEVRSLPPVYERRLTELGEAMTVAERQADGDLPDVYHPGNWGVWLTWVERESARDIRIVSDRGGVDVHGTAWHVAVADSCGAWSSSSFATALLGALCRPGWEHSFGKGKQPPPAVHAWWKAEQEASNVDT